MKADERKQHVPIFVGSTFDHPAWEPVPWPDDAEVIGEVRWAARTFE